MNHRYRFLSIQKQQTDESTHHRYHQQQGEIRKQKPVIIFTTFLLSLLLITFVSVSSIYYYYYSYHYNINSSTATSSSSLIISKKNVTHVQNNNDIKVRTDLDPSSSSLPLWDGKQRYDGGALIHMGKTGGSTISILLRNGCHSFIKHPCRIIIPNEYESKASLLIHSYYHTYDFHSLIQSDHTFYIITIRDPFDRTISSFVYDHILNQIARNDTLNLTTFMISNITLKRKNQQKKLNDFKKLYNAYMICFPSLEHFIQYLGSDNNINNNDDDQYQNFDNDYNNIVNTSSCNNLARAAIHGKVHIYRHLYYNYEKIYSLLPNTTNHRIILYVIRQEHLWDDWVIINRDYLNQTTNVWRPYTSSSLRQNSNQNIDRTLLRNNSIINLMDEYNQNELYMNRKNITELQKQMNMTLEVVTRGNNISDIGRMNLCNILQKEYYYYFWYIMNAQNTNNDPSHIKHAIRIAQMNCPMIQFYIIINKIKKKMQS